MARSSIGNGYAEILGLHADLAERKAIEAALRQADRRKDQFLATLAHELRNPLAPMMTAVYLLKNAETNGRSSERALATLDRQLHHMVRLIDDLLDFSRITRGQIALRRERVAVADVIGAAVETSRPEIEQRRHRLLVELPDTPQRLDVDGVRISQAVSNLLTNAARYMDPGGNVRLSVTEEGDQIVVSVADSGFGIAADLIFHVFEMFVRGRDSAAAAPGGLGIGLTLARTLVEMHGGSIAIKSEGRSRQRVHDSASAIIAADLTPHRFCGDGWHLDSNAANSHRRRQPGCAGHDDLCADPERS